MENVLKRKREPEPHFRLDRVSPGCLLVFAKSVSDSNFNTFFDDENFDLKHEEEGWLSTNNEGPHANDPHSFILSLRANPQLDNKNVVFAKVIEGQQVLVQLKQLKAVDLSGSPASQVEIVNSGLVICT